MLYSSNCQTRKPPGTDITGGATSTAIRCHGAHTLSEVLVLYQGFHREFETVPIQLLWSQYRSSVGSQSCRHACCAPFDVLGCCTSTTEATSTCTRRGEMLSVTCSFLSIPPLCWRQTGWRESGDKRVACRWLDYKYLLRTYPGSDKTLLTTCERERERDLLHADLLMLLFEDAFRV